MFPHVYSLPPFSSFTVLLYPLGPSHYSVKTKSPLSLYSSSAPHVYSLPPFSSFPVLLSPLGPSHYSIKTKSPLSLFYSIAYSITPLKQIPPFTLFQYYFLH